MLPIIDKQEVKVKTKIVTLLVFGMTSMVLSGCVINIGNDEGRLDKRSNWEQIQETNRNNINKLSLGMDREQVTSLMGIADFNEAYVKQDKQIAVYILVFLQI